MARDNEIDCEKTARTDVETMDARTYILSELLNAADEFKGTKGASACADAPRPDMSFAL